MSMIRTTNTSLGSLDFGTYTRNIINTIDEVSDIEKFTNIDYMTRKIHMYVHVSENTIKKFVQVLNPIVQHTDETLVSALLYLRSMRTNMIVQVNKYQREHVNPDFPLIGYLQILNTQTRLDNPNEVLPELREIYNREGTTLKEKMCIADIILRFNPVLGNQMLDEIRIAEALLHPPNQNEGNRRTIYDDSQNVHNAGINSSVNNIIQELCGNYIHEKDGVSILRKKFVGYIFKNQKISKTLERIEFDTARFSGYTLLDITNSLVELISTHPQKDDMWPRFKEELMEMSGYCSTGHAARLVNVIQGFDVADALILKMDCMDELYSIFNKFMYEYLTEHDELMELMLDNLQTFCQRVIKDALPLFDEKHLIDYDFEDFQKQKYIIALLSKYTKLNQNVIVDML